MEISIKSFKASSLLRNRSAVWDEVIYDCFSLLTNFAIEVPSKSLVKHYKLQKIDAGRILSQLVSTLLHYEHREALNFSLSLLTASSLFGPILSDAQSFTEDYLGEDVSQKTRLESFFSIFSNFAEVEAPSDANFLQKAFAYLLSNKNSEAATCLINAGYPRLAMIVIQSLTDNSSAPNLENNKSLYLETLINDYINTEIDLNKVDNDLRRIYLFLAGDYDMLLDLNLSWSHLLLLFLRCHNDPVKALLKFNESVEEGKVELPLFDSSFESFFKNSDLVIFDSKFALLQLFLFRNDPQAVKDMMTCLCDPLSYSTDESNYIFPYVMVKILSLLIDVEVPVSLIKGLLSMTIKENPDIIPLIYSLECIESDAFLQNNLGSDPLIINYCIKAPLHLKTIQSESSFDLVDELIEKSCFCDAKAILVDELIPFICKDFLFFDTIKTIHELLDKLLKADSSCSVELRCFNEIFRILAKSNISFENLCTAMASAVSLKISETSQSLMYFIAEMMGKKSMDYDFKSFSNAENLKDDAFSAKFWTTCKNRNELLQAAYILSHSTVLSMIITKNMTSKL